MATKSIYDLPTTGLHFFGADEYEQKKEVKSFNIVLWSNSDEVNFLTDELFSCIYADNLIRYKNQIEQYMSSATQKCTNVQCKNAPLSNTYLLEIFNNPASLFCFSL